MHATEAVPLPLDSAPYVLGVMEGLPAQKAGMQKGDLITVINGQPISSIRQLLELTNEIAVEPVTFTVNRNGGELEITATPNPTGPRFGIKFFDQNAVNSVPWQDGTIQAGTEKFDFEARVVEGKEAMVMVDIGITNRSDHPITIGPDAVSLTAFGVALKRLSPEDAVGIIYGPALATLNIPSSGPNTFVSQTVVSPPPQAPPAYQVNSTTSTYGSMTYGRATIQPMPSSSGGFWGGLVQGIRDAQAANQAATAQAMPYLIQRQQQMAKEQLVQQYTGDLMQFQRRQLGTSTVPPRGTVEGLVFFDNVQHGRPLELVLEIEGSRKSVIFGD